ncbi:HlyD family efflux transporter periplasmic adaptor subunit [Solwaraspora sp. WMMD937]|uniref:efflux RND transporter periplasmic adaptor subunit n=1 Tax=Solwaraspora sp. WMMD937 TaxID=3016090 RepID=UPI00249B38AD|nr:biotin/lipoyl-binding protein [Solwaraspora sp. WMMD937]WFE22618.1 HlyD family efflux transporter periplasmic adaptor subunit [Solwaraspora sp. WMMD937]
MPVRRLAGLRRPLILNAILVLAVLGLLGWTYHTVVGPDNTAVAAGSAATATVVVEQATVTATVTASGSVRSAKTAVADFVTGGTVTEILVSVGQQVDEGAVLARVDDTVAQRELDAARANLDAAQDALDTAEVAGVSTADAVAAVTEAELAVDEAQAAVDGTTLTAPVAGTVVAVNGSVGASTGGGTGSSSAGGGTGSSSAGGGTGSSSSSGASGFVDLADLTQLEVTASVSETDATRLETGQPATVRWNALPDTEATASIGVIDPNAATTNGVVSYPITLDLDSLPEGVRPGQTVEVTVVVGEAVDVLTVSPAALTGTGTRQSVTVLVDGAQVSRTVEVGLQGDDAVEIISGLAVGEQVVVVIPTESESGSGGFPGGGGLTGGGGFPGGGGPGAGGFSGGGRPGGGR